MGLCRALFDVDEGRCTAARVQSARSLQWLAVCAQIWGNLAPWEAVYQQTQRWIKAGVFEAIVDDLRMLLRLAAGRKAEPSAAIFDSRTLQSSPESGGRAGYDGAKRRKGSKVHMAVDTLGPSVNPVGDRC